MLLSYVGREVKLKLGINKDLLDSPVGRVQVVLLYLYGVHQVTLRMSRFPNRWQLKKPSAHDRIAVLILFH